MSCAGRDSYSPEKSLKKCAGGWLCQGPKLVWEIYIGMKCQMWARDPIIVPGGLVYQGSMRSLKLSLSRCSSPRNVSGCLLLCTKHQNRNHNQSKLPAPCCRLCMQSIQCTLPFPRLHSSHSPISSRRSNRLSNTRVKAWTGRSAPL